MSQLEEHAAWMASLEQGHAADEGDRSNVASVRANSGHNGTTLSELTRPLLQESELQRCFYPFLTWLSQPPVTSFEALVKARRVKTLEQLQPIKLNLRFIFALLYEREVVNEVCTDALTKPFICKTLYEALVSRQVGSSRIHVLFLLVKKLLVFLSSKESVDQRQFVQPSSIASYFYVESICSEHGGQRKQESRNRAVLGAAASSQLQQQRAAAGLSNAGEFRIPNTWQQQPSSSAQAASPTAQAQQLQLRPPPRDTSGNAMSKAELRTVAQGCLEFLRLQDGNQADTSDTLFVSYLVTATLCFGLAPRSQVLKQLQIGTSFEKSASDGKYLVRMLAAMSKTANRRPLPCPLN